MIIDKNSPSPYYFQIYGILKHRIVQGTYAESGMLPSENTLVLEFDVTRITLRSALRMLQSEGLITTVKGKGSFIRPPKAEQSLFHFYSFGRDFNEKDYNPDTELISAETVPADEITRQKLALADDAAIYKIVRIRKLHGQPVILEISRIPCIFADGLLKHELSSVSIYDLLETEYNHPIDKAREYLDTVNCDEHVSRLLTIEPGKAVFLADRVTCTTGEVPMEYRISYIRGDAFRFYIEF